MKILFVCLTLLSSIAAYAQVSLEDLKEGDVILYPKDRDLYYPVDFNQYEKGTVISIGKKYGWFGGDKVVKIKSNSTEKEFFLDEEGLKGKGLALTEGCNAGQHCIDDLVLYPEGFDKIARSHIAGISPNLNHVLVGAYFRGILYHKWVVPASEKNGECTLDGDYCVGDEGIFSDSGSLISSEQHEKVLFSKEKISNARIVGIFPRSVNNRGQWCHTKRLIIKTEERMFNVDLSCEKNNVFLMGVSIADEKCSAYVTNERFSTEKKKQFLERKLVTAGYNIVNKRENATVEVGSWFGGGSCLHYRNCRQATANINIKLINSDFKSERSNTSMYRADPDESITTADIDGGIKIWSRSKKVRELNLIEQAINETQINSCYLLTPINQ